MPVNPIPKLLTFFAAYYFAQGIYNAFGSFEQPWLRTRGVTLTQVSSSRAVAIVPWSIKILFAVPCDMIGRRLPFATVGMIAGATLLICLIAFDPGASEEAYSGYVGTVFARNLGIALSDVAVDGMSVDCGLEHMSGTVQGVMSAGRVIGTLLGSGIGAPIAKESYSGVIVFLAVCIYLLVPVTFMVKEEKVGKTDEFEWAAFQQLAKRPVLLFLMFAMIGNLSGSISGVPSTEWGISVVGLEADDFGYLSVVGSIGDLIGAVGMGFIFDRIDKRIGMLATAALSCLTSVVALWCTTKASWYGLGFVSGIAGGALFVVNCSMVMRLADKRLGASVFAIAVSLMNFSSMIGNAIAGPLAEGSDLKTAFWVSFAVNLLQIPLVPFIIEPTPAALSTKDALYPAKYMATGKDAPSAIDDDNDFVTVKNVLLNGAGAGGDSSSGGGNNVKKSVEEDGGGGVEDDPEGGLSRAARVATAAAAAIGPRGLPVMSGNPFAAASHLEHHQHQQQQTHPHAVDEPTSIDGGISRNGQAAVTTAAAAAHIPDYTRRRHTAATAGSTGPVPEASGNPFAAASARTGAPAPAAGNPFGPAAFGVAAAAVRGNDHNADDDAAAATSSTAGTATA
jgi:hypothetical protein